MPAHPVSNIQIINTVTGDLEFIFRLFDSAINYQKMNGYNLWPTFSRGLIESEIAGNRHWKIVEDGKILCVFSVMYNDPVIWGERDKEPSVYLHRIAVNPQHKGKGMMKLIRAWALDHARKTGKTFVRMDTWGNNETLRDYYISCGFDYIGQQQLHFAEGQPGHYGGSLLSLFQLKA